MLIFFVYFSRSSYHLSCCLYIYLSSYASHVYFYIFYSFILVKFTLFLIIVFYFIVHFF